MGWGKVHSKVEWPVVLAGKAGGRLKGDAHFNYPEGNLSRALLMVAWLMGSTATEYGSIRGRSTRPCLAFSRATRGCGDDSALLLLPKSYSMRIHPLRCAV